MFRVAVASAEMRPMPAPFVAASLNTFNPMMSYTDDTYKSILPGRVKPILSIPEAVPEDAGWFRNTTSFSNWACPLLKV